MQNRHSGRGTLEGEIVIAVPVELKSFVKPIEALMEAAQQARRSARGGGPVNYPAVEQEVAELTAAIERVSHAEILAAHDVDAPRVAIRGKTFTRIDHAAGTYYTLSGPVTVERALYREDGLRNAPVVDAISLRTGAIARGWLPLTAQAIAHAVQRGPSRGAVESAEQTGRLPYSRASFERVAHAMGDRYLEHQANIEDWTIQELDVRGEPHSMSVALDRVSIPMEEAAKRPVGRPRKGAAKRPVNRNYRMAYCGTVTLHDAEGNAIHTLRYGTMPAHDPHLLCQRMANDAFRLRERHPHLALTLLADGAHEMWNLLEPHFPADVFGESRKLVDFWHTIEKLSPAANAIFGDEHGRFVLYQWRHRLKSCSRAATEILDELEASGCEYMLVDSKTPVHDAITYLRNHAEQEDRMNYAAARRKSLPIGSGNAEATCKSLVALRMKRAGSRWKESTGERILQLRALALSDRWNPAMELLHTASRTAVRPAA